MSPKHTQGDWFVSGTTPRTTLTIMAGTKEVATIKATGYASPTNPNERLANAKLLAAAPDLLTVVKLILVEWEAPTAGVEPGALIARLSQYASEARAAIAKAEGKPT